jgi:hypothetical protein
MRGHTTAWQRSPGSGRWVNLTRSPISRPLSTVRISSSRSSAIFSLLGRRVGSARKKFRTLCLIAGYVNRTSHPSGSSKIFGAQFRPDAVVKKFRTRR